MSKQLAKYVDGFVLVVPKDQVAQYRKMARDASKIWMKHGALRYVECVGDDLYPDTYGMPTLLFPKLTKLKENETVWFSYIEYTSKAHRTQVNKKVHKEFEQHMKEHPDDMKEMPFDMRRMSFGGFKVVVNT
ncbi:DUF1428 domain-containing protein [Candidatus Nomurabacteria bacterium]|nr:DUF1428 domain-containing protein [Candidatus Nomurabacteria bacterium]